MAHLALLLERAVPTRLRLVEEDAVRALLCDFTELARLAPVNIVGALQALQGRLAVAVHRVEQALLPPPGRIYCRCCCCVCVYVCCDGAVRSDFSTTVLCPLRRCPEAPMDVAKLSADTDILVIFMASSHDLFSMLG